MFLYAKETEQEKKSAGPEHTVPHLNKFVLPLFTLRIF